MKENKTWGSMIKIISEMSVLHMVDIRINHAINSHSQLWLKVIIEEGEKYVLDSFINTEIKVFDMEFDTKELLFSGKILTIRSTGETVEIEGISYSIELDQEKKYQSFQNPNLTYEKIVQILLKDSQARYLWNVVEGNEIRRPIIQYDETDWEFLNRLASHFNTHLQVSANSNQPDFYFGMKEGNAHQLDETKITEHGFSKKYYECSGYMEEEPHIAYHYFKLKDKRRWGIGDYSYYNGQKFTVYQEHINMEGSNLYYYYTFGASGFLQQKKFYNKKIAHLRLTGIIKKVIKDNLVIQFDIDKEQRADYEWPWVPIVSSIAYFMPEEKESVLVYFPDKDEGNAQAIQILRSNSSSGIFSNPANREIVTNYGKSLSIQPNALNLEGKGGIPSIRLTDRTGIQMDSNGTICFNAIDEIIMTSSIVQMQAPQKVLLNTNISNIELCRDINLYAPGGVSRNSVVTNTTNTLDKSANEQNIQPEKEHWQLSCGALGALPTVQLSNLSVEKLTDIASCAMIPMYGKGATIVSMSQVQEGTKVEDTSFPQVFTTMENYTLKGGKLQT